MRVLNHFIESPSMVLVTESGEIATSLKQVVSRLGKKYRHALCGVISGGHELYRARTDTKLYQQCLLCGYETSGWTIDRRDRRLHLVGSQPSAVVAFQKQRDACDHLRGEEPYDKQRAAFLKAQLDKTCKGSDKALAALRKRFAHDPQAIAALRDYEDRIE